MIGFGFGVRRAAIAARRSPLDALAASIRAAYGLRRLVSSWTGPLITVRRSSDGASLDISAGADGWLDMAALIAFVGTASAFITKWWDQSGNGCHAVQSTAAAQPRIVNAGVVDLIGGRPSLSLDGNRWMLSSVPAVAQPFSVVTVIQQADYSTGVNNRLFHSTSSNFIAGSGSNGTVIAYAGSYLESTPLTDGAAYGVAGIYNGASSHVRTNGLVATGDTGSGQLDAAVNLFTTGVSGTGTGIKFTGNCSDLVFLGAALTTSASAGLISSLGLGRGISA